MIIKGVLFGGEPVGAVGGGGGEFDGVHMTEVTLYTYA
jgi:hypothetical protein